MWCLLDTVFVADLNFQIIVVAREEPKPLGKRAVRDLRVQAALSVG